MNNTKKFLFCFILLIFFSLYVVCHENVHSIFNYNKGIDSTFAITLNGFATIPDEKQFDALSAADQHDLFLANSFNEAIAYNVFPIGASIFAVLLFGVLKNGHS